MIKRRPVTLASAFAFALTISSNSTFALENLSTTAEQSGFQKTGRYEEVETLCRNFQKNYPKMVRCQEIGRSAEGRPMMAIIATRTNIFVPYLAKDKQVPVTLIQGGIHAGEIDGKDAGFLALREALNNTAAKNALDKQVLIFIPVFNVDGHERFAKWNRPNQRGPEEMGWRTTAQNFNLNRDYVKADTPEMQAMLRLINQWDPLVVVDLHVTDGAKFEHDISIQIEPSHAGDKVLKQSGKTFQQNVIADLSAQGSLPLPFYMAFEKEDDPTSGFADGVASPRLSHGYFQLRNRFGILVEAHSWKDYATRVKITRNTIISVLDQVAKNGADWRKQSLEADMRSASLAGQTIPLTYKTTDQFQMIDFRGYAYTRKPSDISGALMTRYDETKPQIWKVKLRDEVVPDTMINLPKGGYLIPSAYAKFVVEKLRVHGIQFEAQNAALNDVAVERFNTASATISPDSFESHQTLKLQGNWVNAQHNFVKGALFVPAAQPKAALVAAMFEPASPDSLVSWGYFNNNFEKKEFMEAYVAEDVAREQLTADPALKQAFEKKLKDDKDFAKNPAARLEFFARRHSSWDQEFQQYPVYRTDIVPK
ncbi:M14 family metallopeptidase [Undibacterium sp. SXout11W]|uniref:M14 family metallopeptidase n=1 Tax=Undibacterium sp. SXout11W TaxID=3413050 RepID=UPI003BF10223